MAEGTWSDMETGEGELAWPISTPRAYCQGPQPFQLREAGGPSLAFLLMHAWSYAHAHWSELRSDEETDSLYALHRWEDLCGADFAGPGDTLVRREK